jgi:hypothetical protein
MNDICLHHGTKSMQASANFQRMDVWHYRSFVNAGYDGNAISD